ncbi:MAG: acyl-CoA synthetase [Candidatus Syntrophoarchaeum sp. GoM_oil]|nr:MAG: acyl-CoA synthetase [Candidatus Syntrophoarchaeum sp. GoM_oil]
MSDLESFLNPKSVAIVGASRNPKSFGYRIVKNMLDIGFEGLIYPINPKADKIAGIKTYKSLSDLPKSVELVVIALPGEYVIDVLKECGSLGLQNAIITAPDVADKRAVTSIAKKLGIKLLGPSTIGLINLKDRFAACVLPVRDLKVGGVSFLAQSGGLSGGLGWWRAEGIGFNKIVCIGEGCDIGEVEALGALAADPTTDVLLVYLEPREPEFFKELEKVALKKPVIFLDPTGSADLEGVVVVKKYYELFELGKVFENRLKMTGNQIGVVSVSSGSISVVLGSMKENGLVLADLSDDTIKRLRKVANPWIKSFNPMDIWPPIELSGDDVGYRYTESAAALMDDPGVDGVFVILELMEEIEFDLYEEFGKITEKHPNKPLIVVCWQIEAPVLERVRCELIALDIPFYINELERPANAYAARLEYEARRKQIIAPITREAGT